jgi:hypothetical protein
VQWGKECVGASKLQGMHKVEERLTLQVFGGRRKECVQGSSLRLEVVRSSGGVKPLKTLRGIEVCSASG